MFVYLILNTKNSKVYVGQTTYRNPNNRWSAHKTDLRGKNSPCVLLQRAWNKHGEKVWEYFVIDEARTQRKLDKLEDFYIEDLESRNPVFGYNIRKGGSRGAHVESTKKKLSIARQKFWKTSRGRSLKKLLAEKARNQQHPLSENIQRSQTQRKYNWGSPIVISPTGEQYTIHTVRGFCREHGFAHHGHFLQLVRGQKPQYKGWTLA